MRRVVPMGKCSSGLTRLVDFGAKTFVCGVLNVTPDRLCMLPIDFIRLVCISWGR